MGAVNYKTSNYITLGFDLSKNFESDDIKNATIDDAYESVSALINKYNFSYINITPIWGYYEGFSLDIDEIDLNDVSENIDEYHNDVKNLNKFLTECVNEIGLVVVTPSWCTGYCDANSSLEKIENVIRDLSNI